MPQRVTPVKARTEALRVKYPDQPHGTVSRRFATLGMRPTLTGRDNPCPHCWEWRGLVYNPMDAPTLPLVACTSSGGCRCRYE